MSSLRTCPAVFLEFLLFPWHCSGLWGCVLLSQGIWSLLSPWLTASPVLPHCALSSWKQPLLYTPSSPCWNYPYLSNWCFLLISAHWKFRSGFADIHFVYKSFMKWGRSDLVWVLNNSCVKWRGHIIQTGTRPPEVNTLIRFVNHIQ